MKLSAFLEAVAAPELKRYNPRLQLTYMPSSVKTTNPVHPREYLADLAEWPGVKDDIKKLLDPLLDFEVNQHHKDVLPQISYIPRRDRRTFIML
ncbi:hypothetical protein TWF281_007735 [Arthrobotrys megalospora]